VTTAKNTINPPISVTLNVILMLAPP